MRRFSLGVLATLSWLGACTAPNAKLSIAYINSGRVMQQYHGTAAKRQQIEARAKGWQGSPDSLAMALEPPTCRLPRKRPK